MPDDTSLEKTEASLLRELADCSRERALIRRDLISFYMKNKRGSAAFPYIEEAIHGFPSPGGKAILCLHYGVRMEEIEDYETAMLCYSKMFSIDPPFEEDDFWMWNHYWTNNNIGYCLNQCKRHKEAESFCRDAIKIKPARHNAYKNLGVSLQGQGQYQEALECYKKATELCPVDYRAKALMEGLLVAQKEG